MNYSNCRLRCVGTVLFAVMLSGCFAWAQSPAPQQGPEARPGGGLGVSPAPSVGTHSGLSVSSASPSSSPTFGSTPSYGGSTPLPSSYPSSGGFDRGVGMTPTPYVPSAAYTRYINTSTSFWNYDSYERSTYLFGLLERYYGYAFQYGYFGRYYRNNEPILNRETLYYALKQPVQLSVQLSQTSRELQELVAAYKNGPTQSAEITRDPRWAPLVTRIRSLAKQIREDVFLLSVDVRTDHGDGKALAGFENLGFNDQVERLTGLITRLDLQLRDMWKDASPSVVSVNELNQPTFQSLAKGIESLAKKIEKRPRS